MTIEDIYKKRKQCRLFDTKRIPDKSLIKEILEKTFKLVASKQNFMPYKVHVIGPDRPDVKEQFWNIVKQRPGGEKNDNIPTAPYQLLFTQRLLESTTYTKRKLDAGEPIGLMNKNKWKNKPLTRAVALEVGMFAKILTGLCIENNIQVAYNLCFPYIKDTDKSGVEYYQYYKKFGFLEDPDPVFSMLLGYKDPNITDEYRKDGKDVIKPKVDTIIKWV